MLITTARHKADGLAMTETLTEMFHQILPSFIHVLVLVSFALFVQFRDGSAVLCQRRDIIICIKVVHSSLSE
jgi:hypothetical protein